jgi:iron complex transport system substrate-binding protein
MARAATGLAATVVAALTLTACGSGAPQSPSDSSGGAPHVGNGAFPRTVNHAMGTTEIPAAPKRVVALDATFVDAAFSLDTPVAGFTRYDGSGDELPAYLGTQRQTLGRDAKVVGSLSEPNLEAIAALRPDLIVSAKVRHEQIYDQLSGIAPTVFSQTTGATWKDNIRLLARALGKEDLAEQRISAYEHRAKVVGDEIRRAQGRNPSVSVVRFVGGGPARLYYRSSFVGIVLDDAGLARPPSQNVSDPEKIAAEISAEKIGDAEADHIFVTTYADPSGAAAQDGKRFRTNPLWGQLRGKIHEVNDTTWMTAVGLQGANVILDDLAKTFGVDPARQK